MRSVAGRRSEASAALRICSGRLFRHAIALTLERASEQFLVGIRPVHLGRIKERDAKLDGPVDGGDGLAPVALFGGSVSKAHPHAAQPERRHFQVISKSSLLHFQFLSRSEVKFISQSEVQAILVRICRGSLTRSCSTCRDMTATGGATGSSLTVRDAFQRWHSQSRTCYIQCPPEIATEDSY